MKFILFAGLLCAVAFSTAQAKDVTEADAKALVAQTCEDIKKDVDGTIAAIKAGKAPYKNAENKAFYVFVYNKDVEAVAHPKASVVGKKLHGKPDVEGVCFRDLIVQKAIANGEGEQVYAYKKPGSKGIKCKKAFFKNCTPDGDATVAVSGVYFKDSPPCNPPSERGSGCK